MKNRLARLLKVLERCPRAGVPDVNALALQLSTTPETIRRDLRDLREAGAFEAPGTTLTHVPHDVAPEVAAALHQRPANDDAAPVLPASLSDDELMAMYVGARFMAAEGDATTSEAQAHVVARIERSASPDLLEKLAGLDTRYRFGPRANERKVRQLVAQAIAERRVLVIEYRGEQDGEAMSREVEPLAQFFIHDRWSFMAFCRTRGDVRQFRHERCASVRLSDQYFTPRGGFTLEGFIERRRQQTRAQAGGR